MILSLATDCNNFFGVQIRNFIDCTLQGREPDPNVVLGNVKMRFPLEHEFMFHLGYKRSANL